MLKNLHLLLILAFLLQACSTSDSGTEEDAAAAQDAPEPGVQEEPLQPARGPSEEVRRNMLIADILYEASMALEDNRLLRPSHDNAYDRYREVLNLDPDNAVARQGINKILERYVQLADNAMRLGQYDNAQALLDRAASIEAQHPLILAARQRLREARQSQVEFFALDPQALSRQAEPLVSRLGEIAQMIREEEDTTFVITARTDEEGRWIYKVMREAVQGHRLRGNISLGNETGIRVQRP